MNNQIILAYLRFKTALYIGIEVQLFQVEVQFSGEPMTHHSNLIWGWQEK